MPLLQYLTQNQLIMHFGSWLTMPLTVCLFAGNQFDCASGYSYCGTNIKCKIMKFFLVIFPLRIQCFMTDGSLAV